PVPPTLGQSLGAGGLVAARPDLGWRAVTRQLPAHGARRAAQGARNRTHGLTGFMQSIQFDTLTQCQMLVARFRHRNTPLGKCCTCFVNSGYPLPPLAGEGRMGAIAVVRTLMFLTPTSPGAARRLVTFFCLPKRKSPKKR